MIEVLVMSLLLSKNIFKRPKLRDDFTNVLLHLSDYMIIGDERPDQVAESIWRSSF